MPQQEGGVTPQRSAPPGAHSGAQRCEPGRLGAASWGSPPQHPTGAQPVRCGHSGTELLRACFSSPNITCDCCCKPLRIHQRPQRRAELCPRLFSTAACPCCMTSHQTAASAFRNSNSMQLLTLQPLLHQHSAAPPSLDCEILS